MRLTANSLPAPSPTVPALPCLTLFEYGSSDAGPHWWRRRHAPAACRPGARVRITEGKVGSLDPSLGVVMPGSHLERPNQERPALDPGGNPHKIEQGW